MEKVFQLIENAVLIAEILRSEGKIGCITYRMLRNNIRQIDVELRKYTFTEAPSGMTFSNTEKFVNEHINYADSETLFEELHRRDFRVSGGKLVREEDV
nr:MAG TPA_asm: hypothetical protein [Caudoviricetes sp.]